MSTILLLHVLDCHSGQPTGPAKYVTDRRGLVNPRGAAWRKFLVTTLSCAMMCLIGPVVGYAQQETTTDNQAGSDPALVNDLLDLLAEPASQQDGKPDGANTAPSGQPLRPADVGLDGEDLGESAENPLISIRHSMVIAAGLLQRGAMDDSTRLQQDIITRLDELIQQLERSRKQQQSTQQQAQQEQSEQQQQQQQEQQQVQQEQLQRGQSQPDGQSQEQPDAGQNQQQTQPEGRQRGEGDQESEKPGEIDSRRGPPGNRPGIAGEQGDVKLELLDPKRLQEGVWGQLPEQVRKQMQSRMVEQFHPAYRRQIEAYFEALLKYRP